MRIASCMIAVAAIVTSGPSLARDLTIVTYGGLTEKASAAAYYEPFTAKTGEAIIMDQDPSLSKMRAMIQSNNITWDIIDQESAEAIVGCDEGLFEKYDFSKLDLKGIPEDMLLPCGVPAYSVGNVMVYDADRITNDPPKTWADFWNVEKWPGKRGFWNTPKGALESAMMADGVAPKDVYAELEKPGGIDRAFAKLDELKPNLLVWNTGAEMINRLASGEYIMTFGWSNRVLGANEANNRNFKVVWDAGFTSVADHWVTLKGTPNIDKVYEFLNYFSKQDRQAEFMRLMPANAANLDALSDLPPERLEMLPLSPQNIGFSVPVNDEFWANNLDTLTERFNAWLSR